MYSQKNIEQLFKLLSTHEDCRVIQNDSFSSVMTQNSVWPNQLYNINFRKDHDVIAEVEKAVEEKVVSNFFMSNPASDNQEAVKIFKEKKYKQGYWKAMTFDLDIPFKAIALEGILIKKIDTHLELENWLAVAEVALMGNKSLNHKVFKHVLNDPNIHFYSGSIHSKMVATAMLYQTDYSGGIYLISTLPEYRSQGIGKTITSHCLYEAKKRNIEKIHIQATQSGEPMYKKLGFQDKGKIELFRIREYA